MDTTEVPFLQELSEQERLHFRNLVLIRPQLPSESQIQLIEGLARSLRAPRLLTLIALGSGGIESEAHALVRSNKSAPSKIVGISTSVDSYLDRLKNVADEKVTSAVGVTRLAILALLRLAHTRF